MARGTLTEKVKATSKELLGYEINTRELRLMPYVDSVMKNHQRIELNKIDDEEHEILRKWQDMNFITGTLESLALSKEFYDSMQQILWIAYADHKNQPRE